MITLEMQNRYAELTNEAKAKGMTDHEVRQYASAHFSDIIATIEDRRERGQAWNKLSEVLNAQINEKRLADNRAKRQKASSKRTINKVATELLATNMLNIKELSFVKSIQKKRSLTERQSKWFNDICKARNIELAEYNMKESRYSSDYIKCDHADLGSLGYRHGHTVICPFCNREAVVW